MSTGTSTGLSNGMSKGLSRVMAFAIAFDVVFSEPSNAKDDRRFADAIKKAGNVVLASNRQYAETSGVRQWLNLDPLDAFLVAGAKPGLAIVDLDLDLVVRKLPDSQDALWRVIVHMLMQQHTEITPNLAIKPGSMILIEPLKVKGLPVEGEIVAIRREQGLIVHRISGITKKNGITSYIARGDSNAYADNPIGIDKIAGRIIRAETTGENQVLADIRINKRPNYFLNRVRVIGLILWGKVRR